MAKKPAKDKPDAVKKMGRPSKFDSLDLDKVRKVASKGWTDAEMADFFEVTEQTWNNWKLAHEDFFESLKEWKAEADLRVERSLYERAIGYSHPEDKIFNDGGEPLVVPTRKNYPPDTTAAIFWLKNRQSGNWRDKQETEHTVSDDMKSFLESISSQPRLSNGDS